MRKIYVIGIGAGDPDHLTLQAVKALNEVDVFFLLDKGTEKSDLIDLRHEILERHATGAYRLVEARDPDRDRDRAADGAAYAGAVDDWRSRRADLYARMISDELDEGTGSVGAFLVWGDPSLYDSTLAILEEILERGTVGFTYEVIPGISSVSALAAKHRIGLNRVARPVQITTGRRLAEGWPQDADDVVVMLDAHQSFRHHLADDPVIYWGAYVGTEDEILVSGRLSEVAGRIEELRAEARARKGWIMDTYLLRRD
ncbi:precorrin-6A synthase (deacetylating) [Streptomyces liangshanensis]|uniref:Precorrin-6A synthase (Deacetylating) n=1 Tax=Streptomyces liangshanensis TaxID=2717324 RepID=A0A6G9GTY3_9ACTN|nr:precorrin-6A synthase (deacetylating) [Streptomyces liangshanensis]QIQ01519.1 precorrin-6A synthase (deacetylating) [Streptomyces liangshanensis]